MSRWSASAEVITAWRGWSVRKLRSNSSASATVQGWGSSGSATRRLVPVERAMPPRKASTGVPFCWSRWASRVEVVVLPCVPATASRGRSAVMRPRSSDRLRMGNPASRSRTRRGKSSGTAGVRTMVQRSVRPAWRSSSRSGGRASSRPVVSTAMPSASRAAVSAVAVRS